MLQAKDARNRIERRDSRKNKYLNFKTKIAQKLNCVIIGPRIRWASAKGFCGTNVGSLDKKTIESLKKNGYHIHFTGKFYNITW